MRRVTVICALGATAAMGVPVFGTSGHAAAPMVAPLSSGTGYVAAAMAGSVSSETAHAAATVPVVVVKEHGAVAVAAAVVIDGRRFPFLIDTGATTTLVNPRIARVLHLKRVGKPERMCGVTGCTKAYRVRLRDWSIGGQALPGVVVSSAPVAGIPGGQGFGLLGSDVLSKFGSVTIDYSHHTLQLG